MRGGGWWRRASLTLTCGRMWPRSTRSAACRRMSPCRCSPPRGRSIWSSTIICRRWTCRPPRSGARAPSRATAWRALKRCWARVPPPRRHFSNAPRTSTWVPPRRRHSTLVRKSSARARHSWLSARPSWWDTSRWASRWTACASCGQTARTASTPPRPSTRRCPFCGGSAPSTPRAPATPRLPWSCGGWCGRRRRSTLRCARSACP
mmetsp:Transcript_19285/g.59966  ORF Transcript_19285/g.59966 Transcript_19285/m.59966 type:complete len:206 (+) Transcript_19285:5299-5916(+)